jgi:hypothetical protein
LDYEIQASGEQTPEAMTALQKAETKRWWRIIKDAGIRAPEVHANHCSKFGK